MTLHIFNPEHDLALACNRPNFTPPHAARRLRACLGFLPALWAQDGDAVLVDNVEAAEKDYKKTLMRLHRRVDGNRMRRVMFTADASSVLGDINNDISSRTLRPMHPVAISPWGWDGVLCNQLLRQGVAKEHLPSLDEVDDIRMLSHRRLAAELLSRLKIDGTVGEARVLSKYEEVVTFVSDYVDVVFKAPWSSSGRGLRFVDTFIDAHREGWIKNVLNAQGSIMAEPRYAKVKDFGMEFCCCADGTVVYEGLSLFATQNGAYTGNVLATERVKEQTMARYLSPSLLEDIKALIIENMTILLRGRYTGPFGVDMMVVAREGGDGFLLHPCVEINLRRTMGHVALSISPSDDDIRRVMRVDYNSDVYELKIETQ